MLIPPLFVLGEDIGILLFSNAHGGEIIRNCCFMLLPTSLHMITCSVLNSLGCEKQTCLYFFAGAAATLLCVLLLPQFAGVYALMIGAAASAVITTSLNLRLIAKKSMEKVRFCKHTLISAASILPAIVFGTLLRGTLLAFLPALPAAILCGCAVMAAQGLFLMAAGTVRPQWVLVLFRR